MRQIADLSQRFTKELPTLTQKNDAPLRAYTSLRIGGPAELMVFPKDLKQLSSVLCMASEEGIVPYVIGAGTNILAPDEGIKGLLIVTRNALTQMHMLTPTRIAASAGVTMSKLAVFAKENALSGLEFAHGIPGTVGGGIYMNAGAYGGEMQQVAVKTNLMYLDGTVCDFEGDAQGFSYRNSAFQKENGIIIGSEFELTLSDREVIQTRMKELAQKRRASQPLELPSAGSAFKRPKNGYAAAMIEQAGLKGIRIGGAAVSEKHAGFIVNLGGATAHDVTSLIALICERVLKETGVQLEPEIRILK